jgi:hypothetical protein
VNKLGKGAALKAQIIEQFCQGKVCEERNEDRVFTGPHHIAVVDGSSAAHPINGRAGGIVAAETVLDVLGGLDARATIDDFEAATNGALSMIARQSGVASPYAAAVVLSLERQEIWRIGDCPFAIDNDWNIPEHNPHERGFFVFRQMMAAGYQAMDGCARNKDPDARIAAVTRDWLAMTKHWVNAGVDESFAFAALDERPAPSRFKEVYPLRNVVRSVILASDGAVVSRTGQTGPRNVAAMMEEIAAVRARDPSCVALFPYWRGFLPGARFLDDTTFVSIAIEQ